MRYIRLVVCLVVIFLTSLVIAQQQSSTAIIPHLIRLGGVLKDANNHPLGGTVGVTFSLYREQEGGSPLWMEAQNVRADASGHYTILLGATKPEGLPLELFTSGEARWLAVKADREPERERVLLVAVPYALKAADAEMLGGRPASAFQLAPSVSESTPATFGASTSASPTTNQNTRAGANATSLASVTGAGTTNFVPLWTSATNIGNSGIFQSTTRNIGIGNTNPAAKLDISGGAFIRGVLKLPSIGIATASAGAKSNPIDLVASSFNGSVVKAIDQTFRLQAESVANNTASPSGKLNLLFASGTLAPAETGVSFSSSGNVRALTGTFASSNSSQILSLTQNGTGAALVAFSAVNNGIVGQTTGAGRQNGVLGIGGSGSTFSIGVQGQSQSSNGSGVVGVSTGSTGIGVSGRTTGASGIGVSASATSTSGVTQGLFARVFSPSGVAGVFDNAGGGKILSLRNNGTEKLSVDGNGNLKAANVINGVTAGSGLAGGGTNGVVGLSLATNCASGQLLRWNGSAWACSNAGLGTVTTVNTDIGLIGGPITTSGTLRVDPGVVPFLNNENVFTAPQSFTPGATFGDGNGQVTIIPSSGVQITACEGCIGLTIIGSQHGGGGANIAGKVSAGSVFATTLLSGLKTTGGSNPTFDASLGNTQRITLTSNVASSALTNSNANQQLIFIICQDSVGGHTFAFPSNFRSVGTVSKGPNTCSVQSFIVDIDNTTVYAVAPMQAGQ